MRRLLLVLALISTVAYGDMDESAPNIAGATDGTKIGNSSDHLKVEATQSGTYAVTGTFWQSTQPVSAAALPLPAGASTAANQTTIDGDLKNPQGSVTGGTAGTKSQLAGGVYNVTLPTLTNGQQVALQFDASGRLITSGNVTISSTPAFSRTYDSTINSGITTYSTYTAVAQVAVKQFYAGGTGIGRQGLYTYGAATTSVVTGGGFEAAGDCGTTWVWTSAAGTGSITQSSAQAFAGTKSCALTFSNSNGTNAQGVKQTFGSPQDLSGWRYLTAQFYNVLSAGGTYTRTISIILTDSSTNSRTFSVSGVSTSPPFSVSGWNKITGELVNPTSFSGVFDQTQVASVELRMADSANRAGTVYWDAVQLEATLTPIAPIFHLGNASFNLAIDPVFVLNIGDTIIVSQQNNDTTRREFVALVGGVSL